ncbi:MAG: hypothetical protein WA826_20175 [Silvibacterium sp.]
MQNQDRHKEHLKNARVDNPSPGGAARFSGFDPFTTTYSHNAGRLAQGAF